MITPHVSWYSEEAMRGLQAGGPSEVSRVLLGEWPAHMIALPSKEAPSPHLEGLSPTRVFFLILLSAGMHDTIGEFPVSRSDSP